MAACITPSKPAPVSEANSQAQEVKRRMRKLEGRDREIPETPRAFTISFGPERNVDPAVQQAAELVTLHNEVDPVVFEKAEGTLAKVRKGEIGGAYPSINRLKESRSRVEKGAPKRRGVVRELSLFGKGDATSQAQAGESSNTHSKSKSLSSGVSVEADGDVVMRAVDRKALTWHDHEITGHDPNDPDDDGEGINGIGFKPTPAIAYHRTEARRRQMAEYKAREARDARAKRGERRRVKDKKNRMSYEEAETERRVRFLTGRDGERETKGIGLAM